MSVLLNRAATSLLLPVWGPGPRPRRQLRLRAHGPKIRVVSRTDDVLINRGMNNCPSAIRDVISTVEGVAPRLRVVVPEDWVRFEEPIPI